MDEIPITKNVKEFIDFVMSSKWEVTESEETDEQGDRKLQIMTTGKVGIPMRREGKPRHFVVVCQVMFRHIAERICNEHNNLVNRR